MNNDIPDIQVSGWYDPDTDTIELIIRHFMDGPSFRLSSLSRADLLEIKDVVDLLADQAHPNQFALVYPRKRKPKRKSKKK